MIYLFPVLGSLIAFLSVIITVYIFSLKLKSAKKQIILILSKKFEENQNVSRLNDFLEENLDVFLMDLKKQIPMGSMLFTQSLSLKIKDLAKNTILRRIPFIKEKVQEIVEEEVNIEETVKNILKSELMKTTLICSIVGFVLNFLFLFFYQN